MPRYNNTASTRTALQELTQRQQQQIEARGQANGVQTVTAPARGYPDRVYFGAYAEAEVRAIEMYAEALSRSAGVFVDILDPMLVIPDGQMTGRVTRDVYVDFGVPADRPAHNFDADLHPLEPMMYPQCPSNERMGIYIRAYTENLRYGDYNNGIERCDWHAREQDRYQMHPYILKVLDWHLPNGYKKLVDEWPHVSVSDPTKVAYTRSPEHGQADRQTVTSLGKYLRMHFAMPDHEIRDLCALAGSEHIEITNDMERMLEVLAKGPHSCMRAGNADWPNGIHPYNVYAPELGWGMAYRTEGKGDVENVMARALVYEGKLNGYDEVVKCFVRSYKKDLNGGYSHSDEAVEAYLRENGYKKMDCWPDGALLKHIPCSGGVIMPYIDGSTQSVTVHDCNCLAISEDGEICGDNTSGYSGIEARVTCARCGNPCDEDDTNTVGEYGEDEVCNDCLNEDYTLVRGSDGDRYYVRNCDAVETREGDNYHDAYLSENGIVELEDGDYAHQDNAVLATDDEWYHEDDEDDTWVRLTVEYDGRDAAPIGDAWQCDRSGNWYHDDDDENEPYHIDGCTVHEDELTAQERIDEGLDEEDEDDHDGTNDVPMTVEQAQARMEAQTINV